MPLRPLTPCKHCRRATGNLNGYCDGHQDQVRAAARMYDKARANDPARAWYGTPAWKRLRAAQLRRQPLCEFCMKENRVSMATICDHTAPHRGEYAAFFNPSNLQSLCKPCHDSTKQRIEKAADRAAAEAHTHEPRGGIKSVSASTPCTAWSPNFSRGQNRGGRG